MIHRNVCLSIRALMGCGVTAASSMPVRHFGQGVGASSGLGWSCGCILAPAWAVDVNNSLAHVSRDPARSKGPQCERPPTKAASSPFHAVALRKIPQGDDCTDAQRPNQIQRFHCAIAGSFRGMMITVHCHRNLHYPQRAVVSKVAPVGALSSYN